MVPNITPLAPPAGAFRPIESYDQSRKEDARTRVFYGDGGPYLRVPGLLALEKVRIAGLDLPAARLDWVLMDATGQNLQPMEVPMLAVDPGQDGCPVLRRGVCSNDGNWQEGVAVFVTGDWDKNVPLPEPPEPLTTLPAGSPAGGRRK